MPPKNPASSYQTPPAATSRETITGHLSASRPGTPRNWIFLSLRCSASGAPLAARHTPPPGKLFAAYLRLQGLTLLLLEPLRADSLLLPYGVHAAQVVCLGLLLATLAWMRE